MTTEKEKPRGGVIPYFIDENENVEMMFMMPSGTDKNYNHDWQVAKGKIDPGETIEEGAFREACEELGMFMPNVVEKYDLGLFSNIRVYVARIRDKNLFGQPDYETEDVRWMTAEQFESEGRDIHKPIVKAASRLIARKHGNT